MTIRGDQERGQAVVHQPADTVLAKCANPGDRSGYIPERAEMFAGEQRDGLGSPGENEIAAYCAIEHKRDPGMIGSRDAFTPAIVGHIASAEARMDRGTRQDLLRYTGAHFRTPGRLLCTLRV
jgi:hypothetical protein